MAALRTQRAPVAGDLVFVDEHGDHFDDHATGYAIEKIAEATGMRRIYNHVLRHTFASHAAMRGIPMPQIQEWLGHSSITVTMRYAHLSQSLGDELIQRLSPQPTGGGDRRGAARSQHVDSTDNAAPSKSPSHTPVGKRS